MRNFIRKIIRSEPDRSGVTKAFLSDLEALAPGQSLRLKTDSGFEFVAMHNDDFEHILQLAGLKGVPVE